MNAYEQKQEARRQRLERAAARATEEATRRLDGARRSIDGIPSGQPILIGHHSEKRHRNALKKHDTYMRKAVEAEHDAQEYARRAEAVGTGGVSSDDPEAVAKLRAKLSDLERQRDHKKAVNTAYRKQDAAALAALGAPSLDQLDSQVAKAYSWEKQPYPKWELANFSARIRDVAKRIADLSQIPEHQASDDVPEPEQIGTLTIRVDARELRVCIRAAERLSKTAYQIVRSHGFVWSPTRTAFVRKYQPATLAGVLETARRAARTIQPPAGGDAA